MANIKTGENGFEWLREALQGTKPAESFLCTDIPYERLRLALLDTRLTVTDKLVRLRHALRYASIRSSDSVHSRSLPANKLLPDGIQAELSLYGLAKRPGGWIEALPWKPDWLVSSGDDGVDAFAMGEQERPWRKSGIRSDPWIEKHFGLKSYRGLGQASAVRSALHMPSGRTLVVLLPTGEGKSLVFQVLAVANPGKTVVVIVPTVTLAQDHEASAIKMGTIGDHEFAYLGGATEVNTRIRDRLIEGSQSLVFAAPEAAVTSLRGSILEAARSGKLAALVIDEAHIVDAWGTDFRCEFQMVSALVAQVRSEAPESAKPQIVCLSATVTHTAYETLRALFSFGQVPGVAGAPRLRPEPDIWIDRGWSDIETRRVRVIEAIRHLPRPAILYVTLPDDAEYWFITLRELGFGRIARVHGGTSNTEKDRVVNQWRTGELDLVVGTSAFGLGIDYAHVRTVIHACLPENIDRYYQEIGRAGRDNRSCIALLIPSWQDKAVAKSQSDSTLISVAKGLMRWTSMFERKIRPDSTILRYIVDLETPPMYDKDMRSGRNEDWNAQVLNLMARSGLISFAGLPSNTQNAHTVAVNIIDEGHSDIDVWKSRVEPLRHRIQAANLLGFNRILELVDSHSCPHALFADTYKFDPTIARVNVAEACGGCEICRRKSPGWFANWPRPPHPPWPAGWFDAVRFGFVESGLLFVERNAKPDSRTARRQLRELLDQLWNAGWRKCVIVGQTDADFVEHLADKPWCVVQSANSLILAANGLPSGPELIWIENSSHLRARHINQSIPDCERIFLIPSGCGDPRNPGDPLAERRTVRQVTEVLNWISQ